MKKILSLVLVLVMVLGLSVPAFAYENVRGDESTINSLTLAVGDVISVTKDLVDEEDKVTNLKFYNLDTTWTAGATEKVFNGNVPESYCISKQYPSCPSTGVLLVTKAWDETDKTIELAFYASEEDIPAAPSGKSGNTDITATVPAITYNIVIPASTALTEENHTDVLLGGDSGKATVEITAHPSDLVNIYYTVDLSAGDLTDGNDHTIAATYTYAQGGDYAAIISSTSTDPAPTKVTVYTGGKVVDSTIKITANDDQWKAAPSGNYTASIVFNFAKEDAAPVISSVEDLIPENFPFNADPRYWPNNAWKNENNRACYFYTPMGNPCLVFSDTYSSSDMNGQILLVYSTPVTKTSNGVYTATQDNITFVFTLTDSVLTSIQLSGSTSHNGTYTAPQR